MVKPPNTVASARPRCSGATVATAIAVVTGVIRPAPAAITARAPSIGAKPGEIAQSTAPSAKRDRPAVSTSRRSTRPVADTSTGEVRA
jgi:hypothetical protein